MNPTILMGLLFDGAQVLFENIKITLVLSTNIIGLGALFYWGISARRAKGEWHHHRVAVLSSGMCGFVLLSYAIIAISRIWHIVLPILAISMLLLSLLVVIMGFLVSIKKKNSPIDSPTLSSRLLSLG